MVINCSHNFTKNSIQRLTSERMTEKSSESKDDQTSTPCQNILCLLYVYVYYILFLAFLMM